jgi:LPXTG-motif cell wall-anchored protein
MRRTIGLGGAAFVAVGAALVLTLPASAHDHKIGPACTVDDAGKGQMVLTIDLTNFAVDTQHPKNPGINTISVKDEVAGGKTIQLIPDGTPFTTKLHKTFDSTSSPATGAPDAQNTFTVTVSAWDDVKDGKSQNFSFTEIDKVAPCVKASPPPPPPVVHSSSTPPPTTTTAALAAASGSGQLPNTGVNAEVPLLVAGVLVVAGGGILLWLRLGAKRRRTDS